MTTTLPRHTDVLVIGAGPAGLAASTALHLLGVDTTVVDFAAGIRTESRAVGVQPRTLEQLARLGAAEPLVKRGLPRTGFVVATRDDVLLRIPYADLATPYPFVLLVPQYETEQVLEDALHGAGGQVLREHRVLSLTPQFDGVEVSIADPQGRVHAVRARYVIGCDGVHSEVRTGLGVAFEGEQDAQHYALADVRLTGLEETPSVRFTFAPAGLLTLSPLPDGAVRLVATVPEPSTHYDRETVQRLLDQRGPRTSPLRVEQVVRSSGYHIATRLAERYRAGRVFLAGDAAHTHSPAGGQGMNTGIQDVINLSWKLASVLHGTGPDSLLDTYEPERRPTAAGVLRFTAQFTALAELSQPTLMSLRDQLIRAAAGIPEVPEYLADTMSQLTVSYPGPGADDHIGSRIPPDGPWASTLRWTLLLPPSCAHTAESLGTPDDVQVAHTETTHALLVRPDGYLAATSAELDESALRTLLTATRTWPDPR